MRTRDESKIQLIHEKAIEMIVKEGIDGFGVNKLAKAAGISPATLYIYFKDRDDLIEKITHTVSHHMLEESLADFDADVHFEEGLRKQWQNRARYFLKYPMEVEFIEKMRYTKVYDSVSAKLHASFKEVLGRFYNNAVERNELVKLPFEVYWAVAFAPLYQMIKFHTQGTSFANRKFVFTEEAMEQALQLVLKALKP